jgi:ABC-type spermidine/putrescine transport system permease subunit II
MIIPFAIPTVVLALSYVRVYTFQPISPFPVFVDNGTVSTHAVYVSLRTNSVDAVDISVLTEASQSLAVTWNTQTKVIMPNIYPGILSGMLLCLLQ